MNTQDVRDMKWEEIQGRLTSWRAMVHAALLRYGPCTTAELAAASGLSILTVRPRVTELCQLGFADLVEMKGKEGVYYARTEEQALEWWTRERDRRESEERMVERQMEMKF